MPLQMLRQRKREDEDEKKDCENIGSTYSLEESIGTGVIFFGGERGREKGQCRFSEWMMWWKMGAEI